MGNLEPYDVIIVGGSYAGLAAGMALGRALRKVLIVDSGNPCNRQTPYSHNFLTRDGERPADIAHIARLQVKAYDTVTIHPGLVTGAIAKATGFDVMLQTGEKLTAGKLVFASGIKDIMPEIPGFADCWGISVLHCPYCHGYEVRNQKTGILGNGDAGFEIAKLISNWTNDITLYLNGRSTLSESQALKLRDRNIQIDESEIQRLDHVEGYLKKIVFRNGREIAMNSIYTRLPFAQQSDIPQALGCELTLENYIKIDSEYKTSVRGVFACGDNTSRMRTVANAVAMGTATGMMVNKELIEDNF